MAESSVTSAQKDRRRTSATERFTPAERLEILQQAIHDCQKAGIDIAVGPLQGAIKPAVVVVIAGVQIVNQNLAFIEGENGNVGA